MNIEKLKLGILLKDNQVVNHRSLFKIIINPILRYHGYCIGSKFNGKKFEGYRLFRQNKVRPIKYSLESNEYDIILKKRRII
jgi:hypothetical protein